MHGPNEKDPDLEEDNSGQDTDELGKLQEM